MLSHLLAATVAALPQGGMPNRSYPVNEIHQQISSNMSHHVHINQPHVVNGYLWLSGNAHQEVWDISDPYQPQMVAAVDSPHGNGEAEGHQLSFAKRDDGSGGYQTFAVTISGRGVDFWNLTDPTQPQLCHALQLAGINYGDNTEAVWGCAWQGRYVFVGGTNTGLHVVDAQNPYAPVVVNRIPTAGLGGVSAGPVWALGNLLVVATPKGSAGIATLDISDPENPFLMDSLQPATGTSSYMGGFFGGNAYLQSPFRTYDVTSDPYSIQLLGSSQTVPSEYMSFGDGRLLLGSLRTAAGGIGGVVIYDIQNPNALTQLAHIPARANSQADDQFSVKIGNLLVLSDDQALGESGAFLAPIATTVDTIAPQVMQVQPVDGALGQALTSRVGISFSDQIEFASVDASSLIVRPLLGGPAVPGRFGVLHTVVSFAPDAPLQPNTTYEVVLPAGGVTDLVGNALSSTFTSTFRTGAGGGGAGIAVVKPAPSQVGTSATFRVANADPATTSYRWQFDDGSAMQSGDVVSHTFADAGRYAVQVTATPIVEQVTQAESAALFGGVVVATNNAGYRGSGFVDYPQTTGSSIRVEWAVQSPDTGVYEVRVRGANGGTTVRRLRARVNGATVATLDFAPSGSWTVWEDVVFSAPLQTGNNTLELIADAGTVGPNIDEFAVRDLVADLRQAEDLNRVGPLTVESVRPGYHGTGYVQFPVLTGNFMRVTWNHQALATGDHTFTLRYAANSTRSLRLYVDGIAQGVVPLPITSGWGTASLTTTLAAGSHFCELVPDAGLGGPDLDEVGIEGPSATPVTAFSTHIVHRPLTANPPSHSAPIVFDAALGRIANVNPDNDTVTVLEAATRNVVFEVPVGRHPVSIAARGGELWVANRESHDLTVLDAQSGGLLATVPLGPGSQPHGVCVTPDQSAVLVVLEALGRLVRIDPVTRQVQQSVDLAPNAPTPPRVRGLAVTADSQTVYVPRFVSAGGPASAGNAAEVYRVHATSMNVLGAVALPFDAGPDTPDSGRGLPNYLASIAIGPGGAFAWVPAKKDNMARGTFRDGQSLTHDSTVRPMVARLDLASGTEDLAARMDLNDADSPVAVVASPLGDVLFVALQGLNEIDVRDANSGETIAGITTGRAPQGLTLTDDGVLFVHDFLDRTVSAFDVNSILDATDTVAVDLGAIPVVAVERMSETVLRGKRIFYDASDPRMAFEGYMSCATCHIDGTDDGQVWDFTDRGEGLRNTTTLVGRAGTAHGFVHWTGNFDEIQDFENDIRQRFGGGGFLSNADWQAGTRSDPLGDRKAGLSPDLDALATYVASLRRVAPSPYRQADGTLTAAGVRGRELFRRRGCVACHGDVARTDSHTRRLHDVGTIVPHSGARRGQPLTGFDTPTLRGVWATAPYLHDGSAATLEDVLDNPVHGKLTFLRSDDRADLAAYLRQIDETVDLTFDRTAAPFTALDATTRGAARVVDVGHLQLVELPVGAGNAARFRVAFEQAVTGEVRVVAQAAAPASLELRVDGVAVGVQPLPATGARGAAVRWPSVSLPAGARRVELVVAAGAQPVYVHGLHVVTR